MTGLDIDPEEMTSPEIAPPEITSPDMTSPLEITSPEMTSPDTLPEQPQSELAGADSITVDSTGAYSIGADS